VDDLCFGGGKWFLENVIERLKVILKIGNEERENFRYIGVNVEDREYEISLNQRGYVSGIKVPEKRGYIGNREMSERELTLYRSLVGQLNWLSNHTRPDVSFEVSDRSKSFQGGSVEEMRKLIGGINRMKEIWVCVNLGKMRGQVEIEVYADASYGNEGSVYPQVGYIVSLRDRWGNRCPITWKSRIVKRVVRSTIEAEAVGLIEGLENGMFLKQCWKELGGDKDRAGEIKIVGKTDSKTLYNAIYSETKVVGKGLRIDVAWLKEVVKEGRVERVEWVSTKDQVADAMTKRRIDKKDIIEYVGWGGGREREG